MAGAQPKERESLRSHPSNNWRKRDADPIDDERSRKREYSSRDARSFRAEPSSRGDVSDRRYGQSSGRQAASSDARWENRKPHVPLPTSSQAVGGSDALSEGRRIYSNSPTPWKRTASEASTKSTCQSTQVTGRNPGYCFVEFETREAAESAIAGMAGVRIEGRPLKTGPCKPDRGRGSRGFFRGNDNERPTFERWGNWTSRNEGGVQASGQGPIGAEEHLVDVVQHQQQCRVFVGGLGKMINQVENDRELRAIFEDFKVVAVSKRITPHESTRAKPGKHHYAFVDLESKEEVDAAIAALNGRAWRGSRLKVQMPLDLPGRIAERGTRWRTPPLDY
ncbi:Protein NAM8 [Paramyrothecium foliicola]|nr:Protein NAM8 [Paramyrothecium foliicola]